MNNLLIFLVIIVVTIICSSSSSLSGGGLLYYFYNLISKYIPNIPPIPGINSKFRTSSPLTCGSDEDEDAALCYPKCPDGYKGVGPVCWAECPSGYTDTGTQCTKKSYGRGAGSPLTCSSSEDEDAGLCYPQCQSGYNGVGPVCWQSCPSGFTDTGLDCLKPKPYGRGAGHFTKHACEHSSDHGAQTNGCYKDGLLWYPYCDNNFHHVGCCICSPDCPSGMTDVGISCQKNSYGRGAGKPVHTCSNGLEQSGLLCYPQCKSTYKGVGPVCWQQCPEDVDPAKYAGMFTDTGLQCTKNTKTRGAGKVIHTCPSGWEKIGLLCYGPCPADYPVADGIFCKKQSII